jgi:hypothetical protein
LSFPAGGSWFNPSNGSRAMDRLLILTLFFLMAATPCFALQTHPFIDQQHRTIYIAQKGLNRLAVLGERIPQVFGDGGAFDLQLTISRAP